MKDVTGKVAFITGGASGMGLAMARSFSAAGMKVAIADIEQDALDRVVAEFKKTNAKVIGLKVDVTDRAAMERAARDTEAAFGKVHVVCNNAGVAVGGVSTP
jgi:NADP-dependent 3-hydroxy acid dehydrogenase YdfG